MIKIITLLVTILIVTFYGIENTQTSPSTAVPAASYKNTFNLSNEGKLVETRLPAVVNPFPPKAMFPPAIKPLNPVIA